MTDYNALTIASEDLLALFDINTPPIPIESMLQHPVKGHGLWNDVDVTQLSGSFLTVKDYYSPRMSLARLLARHIAGCEWGQARELAQMASDTNVLHLFGRMLIMPQQMVMALATSARTPAAMSVHFEVPEEDARLRLVDISNHAG